MQSTRPTLKAKDRHAEAVDHIVTRLMSDQQALAELTRKITTVTDALLQLQIEIQITRIALLEQDHRLQKLIGSIEEFFDDYHPDKDTSDLMNLRTNLYPSWYIPPFEMKKKNHEARLIELNIDTDTIPKRYICPLSLEVINEPAIIDSAGATKDVIIQHVFEYTHIQHVEYNPLNRAKIIKRPTISISLQNIIGTFVTIHEINNYLAAREYIRQAAIKTMPESELRTELLLSNMELLQKLGISIDQVPHRFISPVFNADQQISPRTIFTFPVTITSNSDTNDDLITIDFFELLRYQTLLNQTSTEEKVALLQQEIRVRRLQLEQQHESELCILKSLKTDKAKDESSLEKAIEECDEKYKLKHQQLEELTYDQLEKPIQEYIHPFTGKIIERLEINYLLLHELDMFMLACQLNELAKQRIQLFTTALEITKLRLEQSTLTTNKKNLTASLEALRDEVNTLENNIKQLNLELKAAILAGEFHAVETAVSDQNENARNGMRINGIYYTHQGQLYSHILAAKNPKPEIPEELEMGMIPGNNETVIGYEVTTHPIKLDGEFVIEYERLVEFWKPKETSYLGFWKKITDHTGINPFTGQPIQSITYDYELKRKTDHFMATKGYLAKATTVVIKKEGTGPWGLTMPMSKRRQRALASHHDAEASDGKKMGPK